VDQNDELSEGIDPVILPNGQFCLIREVISSLDRGLVLIVDHWDDQAAHDRGEPPHSSHDHGFGPYKEPERDESGQIVYLDAEKNRFNCLKRDCVDSDDVGGRILKVLNQGHVVGARVAAVNGLWIDRARAKATYDHWGFLAHPHVQALEVTP
jgi:hypothetical protein